MSERPYTVCHILTSLDGKIDGSFMSAPETMPALRAYADIRGQYDCPATVYGTITMIMIIAERKRMFSPPNVCLAANDPRIIYAMLIAMTIWQNSHAVLLSRKAAWRNALRRFAII